jgi:hypothetical protein
MISNKQARVTRAETCEIELNAVDVIELVRKAGHTVPASAAVRIYFAVPGGGDWSNTDIDIDDRNPVRIEWKTTEERNA